MRNAFHIPFLAVLEDRLVWGSSEDGAGSGIKPVVWFTDFKGKIQTHIGAKGMIYPEGTSYLAVYEIERLAAITNESWGLIYK